MVDGYLVNLYNYDWEQARVLLVTLSGFHRWRAANLVPDAFDANKRHAPIMFTTDLALKMDPAYAEITERWLQNPLSSKMRLPAPGSADAQDLGPTTRYLGDMAPDQTFTWQDPIPAVDHDLVSDRDVAELKHEILESGLSTGELVRTAWSSASSFRDTDMRGGANGSRVRLAPQNSWEANSPDELDNVLTTLEGIQSSFNSANRGKRVSLADLIVLGGAVAIEQAAERAGFDVEVPFIPGRTDASQEQTDVSSFAYLEPTADGFRNSLLVAMSAIQLKCWLRKQRFGPERA